MVQSLYFYGGLIPIHLVWFMEDNNSNQGKLTIGRLARAAGVGVTTVRYYQRRGLLREPPKPASGRFRSYGEEDLSRLLLIRHAKELGFTLAEIAALVEHVEKEDCQSLRTLASEKLEAVKRQIRTLNRRKESLKTMLSECSGRCAGNCPLYKRVLQNGKGARY